MLLRLIQRHRLLQMGAGRALLTAIVQGVPEGQVGLQQEHRVLSSLGKAEELLCQCISGLCFASHQVVPLEVP